MGDRANIWVRQNKRDGGVFLYTHSSGYKLPMVLRNALGRRLRWDDGQYLTRIIFNEMTDGRQGEEGGFGISGFCWDGEGRILLVELDMQTIGVVELDDDDAKHDSSLVEKVGRIKRAWTFERFVALTDEQVNGVWSE